MSNKAMMCMKCGHIFRMKTKTGELSPGKAALGALLAGPAGAVVGASMGKTTQNRCCPYCGSYNITFVD